MEPIDIYYFFRKAQSESKGVGFRMPKNFDQHLEKKFSIKNKEALLMATKFFNTKWVNIDVYKFMKCGFELFKTFTYVKFFDTRVINFYIERDKNLKREMTFNKDLIVKSVKFVKRYLKENSITLSDYCKQQEGHTKVIVNHYISNNIDKYFFSWLVNRGILKLNDDDRLKIPYIVCNYREIVDKINDINGFMDKIKQML